MIPGPLIRVRACGMYRIKVVNELSKWANLPDIEKEINKNIGAYLTHLKLHGMHIGVQPVRSDDLTTALTLTLTLTITLKDGGDTAWG